MFLPISQNSKCANMQNGNKHNSKTKGCMTKEIDMDVKYTIHRDTKTMKPDF